MFDRILIANRGEIACRVIATCRRLGIATVAVYSEADASARHVRLADQAVCVGPAAARDSYLRIPVILDAAQRSGAQAIHPGYGFLSENPEFAQQCAAAGLTFIGPPVAAMRAMSSKATAKQLMQACGVPLLPGYHGEDQDPARLRSEAARIGYPVLIKATAGGGGKGMRAVDSEAVFDERLAACQREARASFNDDRVLLEKYVHSPRHIEVQVFGDSHGQIVHLYERDCSAQRRHQKVLEEAPAPQFSSAQRAALTRAACDAAHAVGYAGAGTVEFLLDPAGGFYFLEMNTRIQVEHPVTEMITGLDLVEWQLRVAAGEPLPLRQSEVALRGHAIEVRLYAEVPEAGFLPSSGTLQRFELPAASAALRLETGIEAGERVGIDYDPMLAKLIVHAGTRPEAVAALRTALSQVRIAGVGNNVMFLRRLAGSAAFAHGALDIGFIEREPELVGGTPLPVKPEVLAAAALWTLAQERPSPATDAARALTPSAWNASDGWRLNGYLTRTLEFDATSTAGTVGTSGAADSMATVAVTYRPEGLRLAIGERSELAALRAQGHDFHHLQFGADGVRLQIETEAGQLRIVIGGDEYRLRRRDPLQSLADAYVAEASLAAPMPGRVIAQLVVAGTTVARGAPLLILEAMKMEHTICAPANGTVRGYRAAVGEQVKEGCELIEFEATPGSPCPGSPSP
ncbi:MAG: acetyl/propionyl/methylcrotonyl-CoA carboxylase subunit alpha [Steroidobacterales bacterium]